MDESEEPNTDKKFRKDFCPFEYGFNKSFKSKSEEPASLAEFAHCHDTDDEHENAKTRKEAKKKLITASILIFFFMIGEIIGGYLADSLAIMTDAAHLLTDFASFMISLVSIYLVSRPTSRKMSFGWYRAEIMGALLSVLMIWLVTGILVYLAILRFMKKDFHVDGKIMFITSSLAVIVNVIMIIVLQQYGHGHSHGLGDSSSHQHSHDNEKNVKDKSKKSENINVKAALIHVIGDLIQSIGVMIAGLIIYINPENKIADPICTFLFSILVLITTIHILKDTLNVLMEGAPKGLDFNEVKKSLYKIPGVVEIHNLRMWSITVNMIAISVHLVVDPSSNSSSILNEANKILRNQYKIREVTVQLEEYSIQMSNCEKCKGDI